MDTIINAAVEHEADAIGLSALLVSTSKQMPICVQELHERGHRVPGADRRRGHQPRLRPPHPHPNGRSPTRSTSPASSTARTPSPGCARSISWWTARRERGLVEQRAEASALRDKPVVVDDSPPVTDSSVARRPRTDARYPRPPSGACARSRWTSTTCTPASTGTCCSSSSGGRGVKGEEWERLVSEDFQPRLERMWAEQDYLRPRAKLGYFPATPTATRLSGVRPG